MSFKSPLIALAAATVLSTVGCTVSDGESLLVTFEPQDTALESSFWSQVDGLTDPTARRTAAWLLPFVLDHQQVELEGDDQERLRYVSLNGFNPGLTLLPTLPFWVTVDYGRWSRQGAVERRSFTWTPFWAWSDEIGESPVTLQASGFPLLYGHVLADAKEDGIYIDLHHFVLSLGPLYTSLRMGPQGKTSAGWLFYPLYAAGLGGLLWSSYSVAGAGGSETAHGPLNGYLGYMESVGRSADLFRGLLNQSEVEDFLAKQDTEETESASNPLTPSSRLILGGILWSDSAETDKSGTEMFGRHGPLWGMFGYGKSNGKDTILLLWIPIKTG